MSVAVFHWVVQWLSHVWLFVTPWTTACQASLSFTISRVCSNSYPLSQWCHPTISTSAIFFSCLQSFLVSRSFPVGQFFASGGWSIGASASASVPPMDIQGWFPFGLTGLISLQSKGLSRLFSSIIVWKHHVNKVFLWMCSNKILFTKSDCTDPQESLLQWGLGTRTTSSAFHVPQTAFFVFPCSNTTHAGFTYNGVTETTWTLESNMCGTALGTNKAPALLYWWVKAGM